MNDGKVVRLSVPQLSKERREELAKVVHKVAEDGRISLRTIRREAKEHLEKLEKDKGITRTINLRVLKSCKKLSINISLK